MDDNCKALGGFIRDTNVQLIWYNFEIWKVKTKVFKNKFKIDIRKISCMISAEEKKILYCSKWWNQISHVPCLVIILYLQTFWSFVYIYERPILMGRLNLRLVQILILMEMRAFSPNLHKMRAFPLKMHAFSPNLHKMHAFSWKCKKMRAFPSNLHKMHAFSWKCKKMRAFSRKTLTR